ncbi:MAG TPA: agmatine deiminase family protein, partial [Flavobacteriales bacterium]|nr:agmatine deiminase family protein [Flavobacteriales bacterium]
LDRGITTPPDFAPRTMAEWEEVQALTIAWISYPSILKQIVAAAKTECEVVIVCPDQNEVTDYLMGNNAGGPLPDLDNSSFVHADINSVWIRDYGAECIYADQVDSLYLLDWIYNRPRPDDDASADAVANALGIGIYSTSQAPNDLVHTGGNFMADGFGTAFSSNLVIDENGANGEFNQTVKTPAQVDALMQTWMGISNYIRMETLPYDGIHHIDMHMKLLDEETLLVGEFPQGESDGPQLDENMGIIMANETSVFGDPYRVIRIPMPPSTGGEWAPDASYRTYANNLFVNGTVIVPTYRTEYDTTALRILHEALPGYRIVGIDCDNSGSNIISASGAIHCITKGIGVNDPLL